MNEITLLAITAASIGFFHTLFGPDHYLPFIMMSKARKWSFTKTIWITLICGFGHVAGSVILGIVGVSVGIAIQKIEIFESIRGSLAAWLIIIFGFIYFVWGIYTAFKKHKHSHLHFHKDEDGYLHKHKHDHSQISEHSHKHSRIKKNITPWVLFTIFVLGPCEPLIPILMYPAAKNSLSGLIIITSIFGLVTVGTMLTIVIIASSGLKLIPMQKIEKYSHAIAGLLILASGLGIQFLGL